MSEDSGQDKTEQPSSKRLADARMQGQVARSRELNTVVMLLFGATLLLMLGANMGEGFLKIMRASLTLSREDIFDSTTMIIFLKRACWDGFWLIAPLIGGLCLAAFLGPVALGGWNFTLSAISPKFGKLNPLKGLARIFGTSGWVELLKALLKVVLICLVGYALFQSYLPAFIGLDDEPVNTAIVHGAQMMLKAFLIVSTPLLLVALFDVPYQLWKHHDSLKMSRQELRDEAKQSEGNPEVKQRIRRLQMEAAQGRMMAAIPQADVVVTNPTHFAVALKYDPKATAAPKVVAKGTDLIALQIRTIATESNVPLLAAPPLARALYYSTELEQEIPRGLFMAVAQVLAYIFSLKTAQGRGLKTPAPPEDIVIPEEFKHS